MTWTRAYATQALSDLRAREHLVSAHAEKCHRLHFLQMAAEKACKAHLANTIGHGNVRKRHDYIAKHLPIVARIFYAKSNGNSQIAHWEISEIRRLVKEIEVLAPACDGGECRKDNSEYPWDSGTGEILVPCEYGFPHIDDQHRSVVRLIRLIYAACEFYSQ